MFAPPRPGIYPTTPGKGSQAVVSQLQRGGSGYALFLDEGGRLLVKVAGPDGKVHELRGASRIRALRWYFVAATYDGRTGRVSLYESILGASELREREWSSTEKIPAGLLTQPKSGLTIAASAVSGRVSSHFNGKIDGVKVYSRALSGAELKRLSQDVPANQVRGLVAAWDFARNTHSTRIRDTSGNANHGESVNFPMRAVTGHNWSGHDYDFKRLPVEYNSIYFHDDDLGDAGWKVGFEYRVPKETRSGVYAAWVRTGKSEDYIPFFVRPKKGKPTAKIALLIPTLSYLAYAEEHALSDPNVRRTLDIKDADYPRQAQDVYNVENNLLGLYDRHSDGTGVCYTSRLRPITNMRPKYFSQSLNAGKGSPHQLNADLHLVDWMEAKGYR